MIAEQITFKMTQELASLGYIYDSMIGGAFDAVCHQYGVEKTSELKEVCVEQTRQALRVLFA